jgi:hypothetical protein
MTKLSEIVQRIVRTRLSGCRYRMIKISNRNTSYHCVKYSKGRNHYSGILLNDTLTSIVEYIIDHCFCAPLSKQYEVLKFKYDQSANSLSRQINFKYD